MTNRGMEPRGQPDYAFGIPAGGTPLPTHGRAVKSPPTNGRAASAERRAMCRPGALPAEEHGFHDLRHFFASTLIAANLNPKVIQARLGHATIAETMDTYGHLFPDSEDLGRGVIDAALAAPQESLTDLRRTQESG